MNAGVTTAVYEVTILSWRMAKARNCLNRLKHRPITFRRLQTSRPKTGGRPPRVPRRAQAATWSKRSGMVWPMPLPCRWRRNRWVQVVQHAGDGAIRRPAAETGVEGLPGAHTMPGGCARRRRCGSSRRCRRARAARRGGDVPCGRRGRVLSDHRPRFSPGRPVRAEGEKLARLVPFLVGQFMAVDHPCVISQVGSAGISV